MSALERNIGRKESMAMRRDEKRKKPKRIGTGARRKLLNPLSERLGSSRAQRRSSFRRRTENFVPRAPAPPEEIDRNYIFLVVRHDIRKMP